MKDLSFQTNAHKKRPPPDRVTGTAVYLLSRESFPLVSQESFPPGLTQVFTPNLGSTYLLSTNQATMIAMNTRKSRISAPLSLLLHRFASHPVPGPPFSAGSLLSACPSWMVLKTLLPTQARFVPRA